MKILMVEDDLAIIEAVKDAVAKQYDIDAALTIESAWKKLKQIQYQLVLLDIQLPDGNGLDFIQKIRTHSEVPIIFLSVVSDNHLIARGLDLGADDYVTKPFSLQVLISRINSVWRRYATKQDQVLRIGELCIDFEQLQVYQAGQRVSLTPVETQLFFMLVKARGKILTRRYLLESIWDEKGSYVEDNTLSVHMRRLKRKIGSHYIQTQRNVGYYFAGDAYE